MTTEHAERLKLCPHCALLCEVGERVHWNAEHCPKRLVALERMELLVHRQQRVLEEWSTYAGQTDSTFAQKPGAQEIARAREWLSGADRVLVTGRVRSVEVARRMVEAARMWKGTLDEWNSDVAFEAVQAVQSHGAYTASLGEIRDHSDLMLVVGSDAMLDATPGLPWALKRPGQVCPGERGVAGEHGRPSEHCLPHEQDKSSEASTSSDHRTRVLLLGSWSQRGIEQWQSAGFEVLAIAVELEVLPRMLSVATREIDAATRSVRGKKSSANSSSEAQDSGVTSQVGRWLEESQYLSVIWNLRCTAVPYRDLWMGEMMQWILRRNEERRAVALGWNDQGGVLQQVSTWLTGFPGRVSFATDFANYGPREYSVARWLAKYRESRGVIVWVDETAEDLPEEIIRSGCRTIAIGSAGWEGIGSKPMQPGGGKSELLCWLPSLLPGVGVAAEMFRGDQTILAKLEAESTQGRAGQGRAGQGRAGQGSVAESAAGWDRSGRVLSVAQWVERLVGG